MNHDTGILSGCRAYVKSRTHAMCIVCHIHNSPHKSQFYPSIFGHTIHTHDKKNVLTIDSLLNHVHFLSAVGDGSLFHATVTTSAHTRIIASFEAITMQGTQLLVG